MLYRLRKCRYFMRRVLYTRYRIYRFVGKALLLSELETFRYRCNACHYALTRESELRKGPHKCPQCGRGYLYAVSAWY